MTWSKVEVTETVTAATVYNVFDENSNRATQTTEYAVLPPDMTLPPTAADGRQIYTIPYRSVVNVSLVVTTSVDTVTYPNLYLSYATSVDYMGDIPATDSTGQPTCIIGKGSYLTLQTTSTRAIQVPQMTPDPDDPQGYLYAMVQATDRIGNVDVADFSSFVWPEENVFRTCIPIEYPHQPQLLSTALFLTVTSDKRIPFMTVPVQAEPSSPPGKSMEDPPAAPTLVPVKAIPAPGLTRGPAQTAVAIGDATFTPTMHVGDAMTVGAAAQPTTVVLATNQVGSTVLVVGGSMTVDVPALVPSAEESNSPIIAGDHTFTPTTGPLLVAADGHILEMGSTLISGKSSTLLTTNAAGSSVLIFGGSATFEIPASPTGPIVFAGQTFTALQGTNLVAENGQVLRMGGTAYPEPGRSGIVLTTNAAGESILIDAGQTTVTIPPTMSNDVARATMKGIGGAIRANGAVDGSAQDERTGKPSGTASGPLAFTGASSSAYSIAVWTSMVCLPSLLVSVVML
ncbi:hypothetical protein KVT40_002091 [Elsinoe batatas]|uniref:Uncharacterized protein n=1 Tax=Elsinoe batatas TaxID=2601811 RepID=A0A8K0L771_9PEZI|nr:hypothetical protein KVT40_002091 [Elsinoe batatas]